MWVVVNYYPSSLVFFVYCIAEAMRTSQPRLQVLPNLQIFRLNLCVKVKSRDACLQLERTKVNIPGCAFVFKEFDILSGKSFIDISIVDSSTYTALILQNFFLIGRKPVYDNCCNITLRGCHAYDVAGLRLVSSCFSSLQVNGSVFD